MKSFGPPSARLRSPDFSAIRGARLTDSRIRHYMLAGFYGEERRREALEERKKVSKKAAPVSSEDLSLAMNLLSSI